MGRWSWPQLEGPPHLDPPKNCPIPCLQGTLQKFVDDAFQAILSVNRPVPIAVKYLFDFLDELAEKHSIEDPETLHIWKTNRCVTCQPGPGQRSPRETRTLPAWPGQEPRPGGHHLG